MKIRCPNCGQTVVVNGLGRRSFYIPVKNICDTLQLHNSVLAAAKELGCSRAYIYKVLKANGFTLGEVKNKKKLKGER